MIAFVPATLKHAELLGATMRPEDAAEVEACGYSPRDAAVLSVTASSSAWAIVSGDEVAAVFGIIPYVEGDAGCIWFLTTRVFLKHVRAIVRVAPQVMGELLDGWGQLDNFIDARYLAAVRWAKWLGFEVGPAVPYGPEGRLFHPAVIRRGA